MRPAIVRVIIIFWLLGASSDVRSSNPTADDKWNRTTAIRGLPFCALVLRNFVDEDDSPRREVYVLMETSQVTEDNLTLLFRALSEAYVKPQDLTVWVYTDVEQLGILATGTFSDSVPAEPKDDGVANDETPTGASRKKQDQLAYYKRTKGAELFRYNPNYPQPGTKTVMLMGK